MSNKMLIIDQEKCTGCRLCEMVCSVSHAGVSNPAKARINVLKWEDVGYYLPISCQQCQDAPCLGSCPREAIYKDDELSRVMINYDKCIGCRMCVSACPFGAMRYDSSRKKVFKCDVCDGNPKCVEFCDVKAVDYIDTTDRQYTLLRSYGEKLYRIFR